MPTHCRVLLYGETSTEDLATRLEQVEFTKQGTTFVLRTARPRLHVLHAAAGRPIILNLAGAFTLATALGVDPEVMRASLRTLKPVSNRLEVVEERGRHVDSRRLQLEPVRFPRGAGSGRRAAGRRGGFSPRPA